ncbi:hypothetical protein HPULCUR_006969 [Helicostylum pulchrum]|uniref:Uncharacterized protein n=1 Tax=Helicostylum pulchrum TaxID=562976 RepID=A0ABP9Y3J4_9FUNG
MELIIVESSSGITKENTAHSIQDTIKILERGISSRRKEASHCQKASITTFKKLKNACQEVQLVQKELAKENMGLVSFNGPTVGSGIANNCFF